MPSRRPRLASPGASASYVSNDPIADATPFIATLKDRDGMAIPGAWISVRLEGGGLLRPEGAYDAQAFTFQRTDQSGVVQFTWLPGKGSIPSPVTLTASAATSGALVLRRL